MPDLLIHELPMRWADIDQLSHVNNVVYLDYAMEARGAHVAAGELVDAPIGFVSVEYLRPLLLGRTPIGVVTRVDGDAVVQEIAPVGAGRVFARVTTSDQAIAQDAEDADAGRAAHYDVRVRRGDLGADGTATAAKVFEYAQEARIASVVRSLNGGQAGSFVVAKVDLGLGEPFGWRPDPYAAETFVTHVGRSSVTVSTMFDGGLRGRADAVLVGFDLQTQRSRTLTDDERAALSGA